MNDNPFSAPLEFSDGPEPPSLSFDFVAIITMSMVLGIIGGFIGLAASLLAQDATWPLRLILAAVPAFCAFVASLFLGTRDHFANQSTLRFVHRRLASRSDISAENFCAMLPDDDPLVLTALRDSVARFFHVPSSKIYPTDELNAQFEATKLDPEFRHFLLDFSVKSLNINVGHEYINVYAANSFSEFATLIASLKSDS